MHMAKGSRKTMDLYDGGMILYMDRQVDEAWILSVQRKLYQWSQENPDDKWRDMWGWLTYIRTIPCAWWHVSSNPGAGPAGVGGMNRGRIPAQRGEQTIFVR